MTELKPVLDAIRSMLSHRERMLAAADQRDAAFVELHHGGRSYDEIARDVRAELVAAGVPEPDLALAGISTHNIRRGIRRSRR